jgi:GxxExxY protein
MELRVATTLPDEVEAAAKKTIGCALRVHRELGPGFKEPIYHEALCLELHEQEVRFEREKKILVHYRDWDLPGHRLDLVVEGVVVVELKAVKKIKELHARQVLSYLKASQLRLGLLINFNTQWLKHGIRRVVL